MKAIGEIIQLALLIFAVLLFGWSYLKTTPDSVNGDGYSTADSRPHIVISGLTNDAVGRCE